MKQTVWLRYLTSIGWCLVVLALVSMSKPAVAKAFWEPVGIPEHDLMVERALTAAGVIIPHVGEVDLDMVYQMELPVVEPEVVLAYAPEAEGVGRKTAYDVGVKQASQPKLEENRLPESHLDLMFEKYGAEYGVDAGKLKAIAKCESGYNANAASGPYLGMYQYMASTWTSTRTAMGLDGDPALRTNAEEAIRTTAWKIAHGGIGAWPVCGRK